MKSGKGKPRACLRAEWGVCAGHMGAAGVRPFRRNCGLAQRLPLGGTGGPLRSPVAARTGRSNRHRLVGGDIAYVRNGTTHPSPLSPTHRVQHAPCGPSSRLAEWRTRRGMLPYLPRPLGLGPAFTHLGIRIAAAAAPPPRSLCCSTQKLAADAADA